MRRHLGEILQQKYSLSAEQLEEALTVQKEKREKVGEILVRLGYLKEEEVLEALSVQLSLSFLPRIDLKEVERDLTAAVPIAFARKHQLIPLRHEGGRVLVAASNPLDIYPLDDLRILFGKDIRIAVSPPKTIAAAINEIYERVGGDAEQAIEEATAEGLDAISSELEGQVDLLDAADEAPIIKLVNSTLYRAVKQRASDIHCEPYEKELAIRYRIDGILYNILATPKRVQSSITSRIKVMAGLDIAEKRLPQDGRIGIKIAGREIDVRVSVIPTAHGERVVLRLLDKAAHLMNMEDLGLDEEKSRTIHDLIHLSHGIVLVTGPTGSGKTTTLYAALNRINSPDKNIITIEDPIEYQLKGVGQMQVNPKIALTFANGLRSILRQDPDVIMVGEIRDVETAQIAIHASLTGHLVFSTLHTNDSAGAITRLLDMGIEPFLVSSSVVAIIAQRLVRLLCPHCRQGYTPAREELAKLGLSDKDLNGKGLFRGKGCPHCMETGYRGRTGIYEILLIDDEIREMIRAKVDSTSIKNRAVEKGMTTLREDGTLKVVAGVTTTEEVLRVTQTEIE